MLNERCKNCESAIWQKLKGVDGIGHMDECECIVGCEYAGVDIFTRMLFFDNVMHTDVVCPYFVQCIADENIPYVKHGESAMNIVDLVLDAVYVVKPEIAPNGEDSLIHGGLYYHIEEIIGGIIQKCIDEEDEFICNLTEEVEVHTDGNTLWVNSGSRCEVRIAGLGDLKGMRSTKAVMYKSDNIKDVMIIGEQ